MASPLKIGLILVVVTFVMLLVQDAEADDEVKRKRVIIKVPQRIKHIYHHHTKKVHIHKKKPKKKPHKHVHVVVEEEEIVHPSWKSVKGSYKGHDGWDGWQSPSSFKHTELPSESKHEDDLYGYEDEEPKESRTYGKASSGRQRGVKRGKKKGGRSNSSASFVDPSFEASYEIHHHLIDSDDDVKDGRGSKGAGVSSSSSSHGGHSRRPFSRSHYRKPRRKERSRKHHDDVEVGDEFDELYDRGPAYPERKEDPSWHQPRSRRQRHQDNNYDNDDDTDQSESYQRNNFHNRKANKSLWTLPKVPEVNEYIDDNDAPGPGVRPGWTGGFIPITTYTASVVQNSPKLPPPILPDYSTIVEDYKRPIDITTSSPSGTAKKNPGYLSQVSHTPEGMTVSYRSHIGHSSDVKSPSSSYQSVSYGSKLIAR
ncbi:Hypothetical protein NTJ_11454 [Nesidiocoris tenuis]|uniref:Uncharacterized protein n=1 Tax=Nesidiocoris tenuis TaxID=355587 RepID=A0ABN7B4W1_9HEMI|nr:Hypothetical protein NTJ_11454 [Nesidiocoris tenuis]